MKKKNLRQLVADRISRPVNFMCSKGKAPRWWM